MERCTRRSGLSIHVTVSGSRGPRFTLDEEVPGEDETLSSFKVGRKRSNKCTRAFLRRGVLGVWRPTETRCLKREPCGRSRDAPELVTLGGGAMGGGSGFIPKAVVSGGQSQWGFRRTR